MSTTIEHTCRLGPDGTRVLNLEHLRDCNLSGCEGCAPCTPRWGHCVRCQAVHLDPEHPRTCASCVGEARDTILSIGDQITEAQRQYLSRSLSSVELMLTLPAANYEAGSYVHQSAMSGRLCKCRQRGVVCPAQRPAVVGPACKACTHESCRAIRRPRVCPDAAFILEELRADQLHPFTVFGAWELHWRRLQGQDEPDTDHTTWSSAVYLLQNLTKMAQAPDEDSDFHQFFREIRGSRHWLDDVLRLGHRPDTAGWCPMCGKEKLVKDWSDEDEGTDYHPSRDTKQYADLWYCPNPACGQTYSPEEYGDRLNLMWVQEADRLPAAELAKRLRIPPSTIRDWAATRTKVVTPARVVDGELLDAVKVEVPPRLRSCGRGADGRKLYRVADAEALRDTGANQAAS
ncbi:MAG: hypothetical protein HOV78_11365 [Hamadaea sp.]|nr:hypothetical protein [Hamadaea sp.]